MTSADFLSFVVTMQSSAMLQPRALTGPPLVLCNNLRHMLRLHLPFTLTVDFITVCRLIPVTGLICSFYAYARDFASSFLRTLHYCNAFALG